MASTRSSTSRSATWISVCSPRLNEPSVKRTRRPPETFSAPTATGSTVSGRTSHGTLAVVAVALADLEAAEDRARLGQADVDRGRRARDQRGARRLGRGAAGGRERRLPARGGAEVDLDGEQRARDRGGRVRRDRRRRRPRPPPRRSGPAAVGPARRAAISVARSWAGLRSGRFWESSAAIAATRAAATALPPATTGLPPAPTVRALPAAARSGLGSPPAVGPWEVLGEIFALGGASEVRPRSVSAKAMSVPGLALRSSLAASPVTPITGVAARPAAIAGSGSSPGAAITRRARRRPRRPRPGRRGWLPP